MNATDTATLGWFYFSFATDEDGFLGGVYIQGYSWGDAYFNVTKARLNPGGAVEGIGPLPADEFEREVPVALRNRLLTKEEVLS